MGNLDREITSCESREGRLPSLEVLKKIGEPLRHKLLFDSSVFTEGFYVEQREKTTLGMSIPLNKAHVFIVLEGGQGEEDIVYEVENWRVAPWVYPPGLKITSQERGKSPDIYVISEENL